jgi:hypothetical protein
MGRHERAPNQEACERRVEESSRNVAWLRRAPGAATRHSPEGGDRPEGERGPASRSNARRVAIRSVAKAGPPA